MSDSPKYPGLCKQYDDNQVEQNGNEYAADLEFNSINGREGNAGNIAASHIIYKTYNGEYDSKRGNNNGVSYVNRNYNRISNNELHSFVKRHQQSPEYQQYATNGATKLSQPQKFVQTQVKQQQQSYREQQQQQTPNYQQMTPFLRAFQQQQQQHNQKRPIDRTNPFQTYRWDQLFKNHV
jgi:hypothetical protein